MYFRGGWRRGVAVLAGLAAFVLVLAAPALVPGPLPENSAKNTFENTAESTPEPAPSAVPEAAAAPASSAQLAYRAVWVSYLEWQRMDFSSAEAFGAEAAAMLDNIVGLGANVVLAQVRPFGDALYPSALYPFSHLATGTQGADPGFDPRTRVQTFPDARSIAGYLRTDRRPGDVVLFKAGRESRFEQIISHVYHDKELTPLAGEPEWRRKKPKPGKLRDVRDSRKEGDG